MSMCRPLTAPSSRPSAAGHDEVEMRKVVGRKRYFTPAQAIEYGIIDRIVQPQDAVKIEAKVCDAPDATLL